MCTCSNAGMIVLRNRRTLRLRRSKMEAVGASGRSSKAAGEPDSVGSHVATSVLHNSRSLGIACDARKVQESWRNMCGTHGRSDMMAILRAAFETCCLPDCLLMNVASLLDRVAVARHSGAQNSSKCECTTSVTVLAVCLLAVKTSGRVKSRETFASRHFPPYLRCLPNAGWMFAGQR